MAQGGYALVEQDGGVALVTLNEPDALNAFTAAQMNELVEAFKELDADRSVRVVVVTGAGRAFCAGSNLHLGSAGKPRDDEHLYEMNAKALAWWMLEIYRVETPLIAAVNGPAAGAGLSLAMTCDIRLASEKASFVASWVDRGIGPDAGASHYLPRMAGPSVANEMAMTAEPMDAQRALQTGIVSRLYAPDDAPTLGVGDGPRHRREGPHRPDAHQAEHPARHAERHGAADMDRDGPPSAAPTHQ